MKYSVLYQKGRETLHHAGIQEADLDARVLLEYVCKTDYNTLLVHPEYEVDKELVERYEDLLAKRASRIPLQHLTGWQNFMGLDFVVNEHVLVPRQDTELLVEETMGLLHEGMSILDLCTGSGCILLSVLHYSNTCTGVGVDLSEAALAVARENANRLGLESRVEWITGNLFEQVDGKFDFIVSNPPYIATKEIDQLEPEVRDHEPRMALDGFADGLFFYREIVANARRFLQPGGYLLFEIGYDQGVAVVELMKQAGFLEVQVKKDYAGLDRVVCGYNPIINGGR